MIEKQFFKYAAEFTAGGRIGVFCEPVVPFNTGGKGAAGDVGGADIDFPASAGETEYIAFGVKGAVRIIVEAQIQVLCNFTFEQIKGRRLGNAEVASGQNADLYITARCCSKLCHHGADAGFHQKRYNNIDGGCPPD